MLQQVNAEKLHQTIQSNEMVLIDFYADWCGPCKMINPHLEDISQREGSPTIVKVNVDNEQELASLYGVMSIPTLILIKNKDVVASLNGFQPADALMEWIKKKQ